MPRRLDSCLSWVEAAILDCAEAAIAKITLSHDGELSSFVVACAYPCIWSAFLSIRKNSPLKTFLFLQLSNVVGCLSRRDRRRRNRMTAWYSRVRALVGVFVALCFLLRVMMVQVAHHRWGVGTVLSLVQLDIPANYRLAGYTCASQRPGTKPMDNWYRWNRDNRRHGTATRSRRQS